jgi:uncharacterized protein DUF4388
MKNAFEAEGELREVDPLAALVSCWRQKTSGTLRFTRGAAESGFDLEEGEIVAVTSSDPRFETAAILIRAGKLAAEAVEGLAPQGGDAALAALQTGLLTRREWKWGEKIRAIEVLSDLLSWNDGSYRFDAAARPRAGEFRLPVPRLLLELFLRSRDRSLIDHQLGAPDHALVRSEQFDAEFPNFGLTADAESVVRLIDGQSTAAEIAQKAPADEFAVLKLLAALVTLDLVRSVPRSQVEPFEVTAKPERETEPAIEVSPVAIEELPERETPRFDVPVEVFSEVAEALPVEIEVPAQQSEAEPARGMVELPALASSGLDRFEAGLQESHWEAGPAPEPERPRTTVPEAPELFEVGGEEPPSGPRRGGVMVWALGILAALIVAVLLWRAVVPSASRSAAKPEPTTLPAVTFPLPVTAAPIETKVERPTAAPATPRPIAASPRPVEPTAAPPSRARKATAAPAAGPVVPAPPAAESREAWTRRAERDRSRLETDRRTHFAIQLELVCEVASLNEAWRHDRSQAMWLLPVSHEGRNCFRVFWGRYTTLEAAKKGKAAVPSYFTTARNHPAVVSVR